MFREKISIVCRVQQKEGSIPSPPPKKNNSKRKTQKKEEKEQEKIDNTIANPTGKC